MPEAGDTMGAHGAATVVFHSTALAGIVGAMLGVAGTTGHSIVGIADGGAAGNSGLAWHT